MTSFPVRECGDGLRKLEEDFALYFPAPNALTAWNAASLPVFNDETAEIFFFLKIIFFCKKIGLRLFTFLWTDVTLAPRHSAEGPFGRVTVVVIITVYAPFFRTESSTS